MQVIKNNPYRIVGLLVGATTREQERQVRRLKQLIEADQNPHDDFSFPTLGNLHRTLESVTEAASKLNLDSDRINAALFWFWNGNPITDEAAFDALKDGDTDTAYKIWDKLVIHTDGDKRYWNEVTPKNLSAFHNQAILSLLTNQGSFVSDVMAKIKFIESDYFDKFVKVTVDETYRVSKKDIQLNFLKTVFENIDNKKLAELVKYLNEYDFAAKTEFQKRFVQKPIEQIEQKIDIAKSKRKSSKANAAKAGQELFESSATDLIQLKSIIGTNDIKYASIADKLANEILQCSIDYFNENHETESNTNYFEPAMKLANQAEVIAVGNLTKDRVKDSINTLKEMKDRELSQAIDLLNSIKDAYEENESKVRQQVREIEETDYEIRLGYKSINQSAVEDNIKNSINWQKVNELLVTALSSTNLKKIKESDNNELKIEFLELANWLKKYSSKNSTISTIINDYKRIPPKLPFKILSSEVTNTSNKPLYTKFIRYLGLNLNVEVTEDKSVTFYIKYINPNGKFKHNSQTSPSGYTNSHTHKLNLHTRSINLSGWGNADKCTYDIGENRIEVYVDEYLIHSKTFVVDLAPSEKLEIELKKAEDKLKEINNTQYFKSEISSAQNEMSKIKGWQFLRSQSDRETQINDQQQKINTLVKRADTDKSSLVNKQQTVINEIKSKIQKAEY